MGRRASQEDPAPRPLLQIRGATNFFGVKIHVKNIFGEKNDFFSKFRNGGPKTTKNTQKIGIESLFACFIDK